MPVPGAGILGGEIKAKQVPEPRTRGLKSKNHRCFHLDALSVPETLETTIRSFSVRSIILARRLLWWAQLESAISGFLDPGSRISRAPEERAPTRTPELQISTRANFSIDVPKALETIIRSFSVRSIILARRFFRRADL